MDFRRDLTGLRFEKLTVIKFDELSSKRTSWICQCDCGNKKSVTGSQLVSGKTKSCGCLHIQKASDQIRNIQGCRILLPEGEAAKRKLIRSYRFGAVGRELEWSLTDSQCEALFVGACYYCGDLPTQIANTGSKQKSNFSYNGIDRIDNDVGYVYGNVVSCCKICNRAKRELSYEAFVGWIFRLSTHFFERSKGLHNEQ